MKQVFLIALVASLILPHMCLGQSEYGKFQVGVYFQSGNSLGITPVGPSLQSQVNSLRHGYVGSGIYSFVQLRNDSTYNTGGFFRFLRVDFGLAVRSGQFESSSGNIFRLTSADLDFGVLLPLSFKAAEEIDAYCSAGPVISYRYNSKVNPIQTIPEVIKVKLGIAIELGFRLKSGSVIGYRTITQSGEFSYRVGSIFFGFSPQNMPNGKKR